MKKKALLDSDIILDVLLGRAEFYDASSGVFNIAMEKKITLYTTPVIMSNVFYFVRKKYGIAAAKQKMMKLLEQVKILPVNASTVDKSLHSKFTDFEDGLQYFAAKQNKVPILITRNTGDYKEKQVLVQTADEFVSVAEGLDV